MAEPATVVVAHLVGGDQIHAADAVLYGLAALGLCAGIALFASGRAGRIAPPAEAAANPPSDPTAVAGVPLVKARPADSQPRLPIGSGHGDASG